ncbi:MAG: hypothetical protein K8H88_18975, partial [Sandaracinaceae bacterium]|nr:hypothetical protein [Sandaracinaceae bacterium]
APGAERAIASPRCGSLRESATALEMVAWQREEEPRSLVRLDLDGAITARGPELEVFTGAFWWGRAVTAGSSGLILAMREGVEPSEVWAQRVVELEPIEPAFRWRVLDRPASRIGLTPRRDGTLVGWLEGQNHESQERFLSMAALGPDARWLAEPAPISDVVFYRDAGWSMSAFEDLHVVIAVEDRARDRRGEQTRLWLVPVGASARALSSAISLYDGAFVRTPIVRAHPSGALVVFRGTGPTSFTGEVFALPVRCVR